MAMAPRFRLGKTNESGNWVLVLTCLFGMGQTLSPEAYPPRGLTLISNGLRSFVGVISMSISPGRTRYGIPIVPSTDVRVRIGMGMRKDRARDGDSGAIVFVFYFIFSYEYFLFEIFYLIFLFYFLPMTFFPPSSMSTSSY
ncbi:uncharacterized protein F4822DRAFT_283790 [Hypoxylon trugodes]|uniref:uncharacterized protein n=1 Tax=Hypoxylon trugodes TaxID=326681 RepID=UPI002197E072|nr:uncharacterized protein F4822DRAFT_283790 [Hypoxylon trugodes]KAI1387474.1 hypothetical protein F4822DRAFT_283790 [Hypoxylon trugodes]